MKELPEELTAELLGLILDQEVKENSLFIRDGYLNYYALSEKLEVSAFRECSLNIDTLSRLMKEWCWDNEYAISIYTYIGWVDEKQGTLSVKEKEKSCGNISLYNIPVYQMFSEFEAVLKATHWVAKTKGLI